MASVYARGAGRLGYDGDMSETLVPAALPLGLPSATSLFAFAAGAERRVRTLRMRIEERTVSAAGDAITEFELLVSRPHARVTTRKPNGTYEIWATDGTIVDGYNAATKTATRRPHRAAPTGLDDRELAAHSRIPDGLGPLPAKGWATTFVRPSSFCNSVLAGALLGNVRAATVAGRAALIIDAAAPRTVELAGDRADFRYEVAFDRLTGMLLAVDEYRGARLTRSTAVTALEIDAPIPVSAFVVELPADAVALY